MWAELAVLALVSVILFQFILERDLWRVLLLFATWYICFLSLEIIFALIIVNMAQFSRPAESVAADGVSDG